MTPQHRAAKSPRRNRGWLGVAATAALVATSLGGAAFAATNEQQSDSLPLGSETQLFEENEDFTTEAPEEGVEGTVGSTAPDPVEGEEGDSEEAGEGTTEENGDAGGPLIDSSDPSDELDGAMTVQPQAEVGLLAAASVTVRAGGLRTALNNIPGTNPATAAPGGNPGSGIGGLEGVTFQLYSAQSGGTAYAGASCVTDSNGQCTINFNNSSTAARPWVGISALPAGYTAVSQLWAGKTVLGIDQANRAYRYQLADVTTYPSQQAPTWNPWANLSGLGTAYNTQNKFWTKGYAVSPEANRNVMGPLLSRQSSGYMAAVRDNPPLPFASGSGRQLQCAPSVNVGIVMDLSNSTFKVKDEYSDAVNALIDELAKDDLGGQRDNVNLSLFSFGSSSPRSNTQNYTTPVNLGSAENVATMKNRVEAYRRAVTGNDASKPSVAGNNDFHAGATNWDAAFWAVAQAPTKYDSVLFITDGDPTTWGSGNNPGLGGESSWPGNAPFVNAIDPTFRNIEFGMYSANLLKNQGTRVTVVGVGDRGSDIPGMAPMPANLAAVSGPIAFTGGNLANSDYTTPTWAELAKELGDWADAVVPQPCDAWVTVQKETKAFDQTAFSPAAGWTFDLTRGTVPDGTTLTPTGTTGQTAGTDGSFTWKYTFPTTDSVASGIKLAETAAPTGDQLDKWRLSKVVCTAEGGAPIESTLADLQASIGPDLKVGDHYTCKFSNEQAGVKMNKYWTVNGTDYPVNQMPTSLDTTWNATPTLESAPTKPDATVGWGKDMGIYKPGDKVQVGETAVTEVATNLPGCKLTKSEIKGPGIGESYVPLELTAGTGSAEGTLGAGLNVYDLHNVVTCEQELTLIKQVDNVEGGVAEPVSAPGDWTLTAQKGTDTPAINEKPATTVPPVPVRADSAAAKTETVKVLVGDYALTEAFGPDATSAADGTAYQQQAQWACTVTKPDGSTADKTVTGTMPAASVNVGIGEHVTCRVVNETAELTVLKKVVGGSAQPSDWTLTATPETAGLAKIEAPGALQPLGTTTDKNTILVKPGEKYTLAENEGSAAYFQTAFQKYDLEKCDSKAIDQDNDACWTDANASDVSVAALERGIYRFVNTNVESPKIPPTGGQSAAMFAAIGGGILVLGAAGGAFALRRRNQAA